MICVYAVNKKMEYAIILKKIELDIVKNQNNNNKNNSMGNYKNIQKNRFSNFKFQKIKTPI